jgi:hypothetical protein
MIYTYTIYYISGAKNDLRFLMVICVSKTCFILYTINHVLHSVHYILELCNESNITRYLTQYNDNANNVITNDELVVI